MDKAMMGKIVDSLAFQIHDYSAIRLRIRIWEKNMLSDLIQTDKQAKTQTNLNAPKEAALG